MTKIVAAAQRSYSLKEISDYLKDFETQHTLTTVSSICSHYFYSENYPILIQVIPATLNAIVLFCEGHQKTFSEKDFEKVCMMVSSMPSQDPNSRGHHDELFKVAIRTFRYVEDVRYVFGRLEFIFNWIKSNKPILAFEEITKFKLEDFLILFFGSHALSLKGKNLALFNPHHFFKESKYSDETIGSLTSMIDSEMSLTIQAAKEKMIEYLKNNNKTFESSFTMFEDRPFLSMGDSNYLLIAPHFGTNNLVSICFKFYSASYSNNFQNNASQYFGLGFEEYISLMFENVSKAKQYLREPPHYNTKNKGVDLVFVKKGKIPVFIEIQKAVVYKSVIHDFSISTFESFLRKVIIPKFEQTFEWLTSHDFKFNNVNLKKELDRIQMILCMSQSVPLLQFNETHDLLIRILNESWTNICGSEIKPLKSRNIYILGCHDVEVLTAVCKAEHLCPSIILFEYKKYFSKTSQFGKPSKDGIELRLDFGSWLSANYKCNDYKNEISLENGKTIFDRVSENFKRDD